MDACRHPDLPWVSGISLLGAVTICQLLITCPDLFSFHLSTPCSLSPYQCYELTRHSDQIINQSWSVGPYLCRVITAHVVSSAPSRAFSWTMQMIVLEQDVVTGSEPHGKAESALPSIAHQSTHLTYTYMRTWHTYVSTEELMLSHCGAGEDSWESLGQQGDQTNQS